MTPLIASLASIALIAGGLSLMFAGQAIWFVVRYVVGFALAIVAALLAFAVLTVAACNHVNTAIIGDGHLPATPEVFWTSIILGAGVISLAVWRSRPVAPTSLTRRVSPKALTSMAHANAPRLAPLPLAPAAPRPVHTTSPAVRDARLALCGLGFSKSDAAAAVAAAMASLGPQASLPALIKASLQRTAELSSKRSATVGGSSRPDSSGRGSAAA